MSSYQCLWKPIVSIKENGELINQEHESEA